jgi:transposase-like protein
MLSMDDLFEGREFDREIIILCVRWYLRFKLGFRDLVLMMAERGIILWIARYVSKFEKRWNRFACRAGTCWRVDESYVKIKGRWTYIYHLVDKQGKTVDFLLRANRDVAAAKAVLSADVQEPGPAATKDYARRLSGLASGRRGKSLANISAGGQPESDPLNI